MSEITKMNEFRTRFWAISYIALVSSFGENQLSVNDFRIWFWTIHYIALASDHARNGAKQVSQNDENERLLNPVLSDSLYSFGAKQVSKMMKMSDFRIRFWTIHYIVLVRNRCRKLWKMNDFRTRFGAIHYIALMRNMCRKWWKWTISEPGFERFLI